MTQLDRAVTEVTLTLARNEAWNRLTVDGLVLSKVDQKRRLHHYRAALALTDKLRDPKHLAYLRASGFLQKFGIDVDAPGYMDTRRGTLKRIIARLEVQLGT
jgi:hypothetical protein